MSQERMVYYVQPAQGENAVGYEVRREDAGRATETNITMTPQGTAQDNAIEAAKEYAKYYWEERGVPTQVRVRRTEDTEEGDAGTFREEYTYGEDPEEIPG